MKHSLDTSCLLLLVALATTYLQTARAERTHLVKFIGLKHDFPDQAEAKQNLATRLSTLTRRPIIVESLDQDGATWYCPEIVDCAEPQLDQLLATIRGPSGLRREYKMLFNDKFAPPSRIELEWLGPCANIGRKRSQVADGGESRESTTSMPEAPSTTTEQPTTTPDLPTTPPTLDYAEPTDQPTMTATIEASAEATVEALTEALTEATTIATTEATTEKATTEATTTTTTTEATTTTTTSEATTTTATTEATTTTTTTEATTTTTSIPPQPTTTTAPEPTPTTGQPSETSSGTATTGSTPESLVLSNEPHYGKYLGLSAAFLIFAAYIVCARSYRRQGRYELSDTNI